ncbi:MAG: type IV pilus secretin PilQ [Nitrospinae bacterium]|nr:type IV pilus secretin PilQ [Nitrospinota bacterium]
MKKKLLLSVLFLGAFAASCASPNRSGEPRGVVREGGAFVTSLSPVEKKGGLELTLEASGKIQYTIFKLENPKRVVIDLPMTDSAAFSAPINLSKGIAKLVTARYFPKTGDSRVEIAVKDSVSYSVSRISESKIVAIISPAAGEMMGADTGSGVSLAQGEVEIAGIDLREASGMARVVIPFKGEQPKFEMIRRRELNRITLDIPNARITKANEKLLTVETEDSLVKNVAVFQFSVEPPVVKVVANLKEFSSSNAFAKENNILLDIGPDAVISAASEIKIEKKVERSKMLSTNKEKVMEDFEGRKISLDFQAADVHNILRILADVGGMNIITSEKVQGKVSMKLVDVPWDMALEIVLKNNQLAMVKTGNVIRVATAEEIAKEKENDVTSQATVGKAEPLYLKVFQVNFESSSKLKANLESVKGVRGRIDINERTNTLIVQDTKEKLAEMEQLIAVLDKRTVQVLIEARIVEVTHTSMQQLGINWGGAYTAKAGSTGLPGTVGLSGISAGAASSAPNSIVNLGTTGTPTGALGLRFGSVDSTAVLDMQLMALENDGLGRILSMPKISTMNNIEALIESGREIPYQTTSASGTQTQFKTASLVLKVTPHATDNNLIRLEIEANKDAPDFANQLPNSPPPILTKHAKTVVLIKDGETTVIGGLFSETTAENHASVPFLSQIPIIGNLFKNRSNSSNNEELLIFITPKVL